MDPEWLATLDTKDYLFPLEWPLYAWLFNLAYAPLIVLVYRRRRDAGLTIAERAGSGRGMPDAAAHLRRGAAAQRRARGARGAAADPAHLLDARFPRDAVCRVGARGRRRAGRRGARRLTAAIIAAGVGRRAARYVMLVRFPDRPVAQVGIADNDWGRAMAWARATPRDTEWVADPMHAVTIWNEPARRRRARRVRRSRQGRGHRDVRSGRRDAHARSPGGARRLRHDDAGAARERSRRGTGSTTWSPSRRSTCRSRSRAGPFDLSAAVTSRSSWDRDQGPGSDRIIDPGSTDAAIRTQKGLRGGHLMTIYCWGRPRAFPRLPPPADPSLRRRAGHARARALPLAARCRGPSGAAGAARARRIEHRALHARARRQGLRARLQRRSCSTSATAAAPKQLSEGLYHSGLTADADHVIRELAARRHRPRRRRGLFARRQPGAEARRRIRRRAAASLRAVCAVSPVMELAACVRALERRQNFVYQWNFVRGLKARMRRKARVPSRPVSDRSADRRPHASGSSTRCSPRRISGSPAPTTTTTAPARCA